MSLPYFILFQQLLGVEMYNRLESIFINVGGYSSSLRFAPLRTA